MKNRVSESQCLCGSEIPRVYFCGKEGLRLKKIDQWLTRHDRREIKKLGDQGILDFLQVKYHFFQDMNEWIQSIEDPRNPAYITYTQSDLISMGLLKNVCGITSMNQMNERFNEECCIRTLGITSDNPELQEMPHGDTLNNYLEKLRPENEMKIDISKKQRTYNQT